MLIKTLLNKRYPLKSHVYQSVRTQRCLGREWIVVEIAPRANGIKVCSNCDRKHCPGYDRLPPRDVEFIPLLGMKTYFRYVPRRVDCPDCGPTVEKLPWVSGKSPVAVPLMLMLSFWSRYLSYSAVGRIFEMNFQQVFASVCYVVEWGLDRRDLSTITAIGIDEIQVKLGHTYMTLVYQIDTHCRRLLWAGAERKEATIRGFFDEFMPHLVAVKYVCSDMWKPYLKVVKEKLPQATHILDRFHIVQNLNKAMDQVRREEAKRLEKEGYEPHLKGTRWALVKRKENLTENQKGILKELLKINLKSTRAYLLKVQFDKLWQYEKVAWAEKFLDGWCTQVMRSKIEPLKKFAKSMRRHKPLIMNYFRAKKMLSSGAVEGLNNIAKLTMRKSFGFRTEYGLKIALFHQLGRLPEPKLTHRLW